MSYDLVIRNGTIVDGLGGEPYVGDVAIADGVIVALGTVEGDGAREIDAAGLLVTPGFVDLHTHYDGQAIWSDRLSPSSSHGVTTALMGNCGVGFAPCRAEDHDVLVDVMAGVEDIPGVVMTDGLPWDWETFPEYLDALESRRRDIDVAAYLPHSPLRVYVMGRRGADREAATPEDLATTVAMVEEAGGAMVSRVADVRDLAALEGAVAEGLDRFGRLDIVVANAGVMATSLFTELSEEAWDDIVGTNLTGVWKTVRAAAPAMIEGERGGSVVITSSIAGLKGLWVSAPYVASKHGVTGLMKTMALELSPHNIRVNTVHPSSVRTPMIENEPFTNLMRSDLEHPTFDDVADVLNPMQALDLPWLEASDIANAVLWLCSDEARGITGVSLPVDGGNLLL